MKRILAVIVSCLIVGSLSAQTVNRTGDQNYVGQLSVGTGTTTYTPTDPSAALQVGLPNTTKGLLLPRVADTSSIAAPAFGLQVFSLVDSTVYVYAGKWVALTDFRSDNKYIKNQTASKQNANSWYKKSIADTITNQQNPASPFDFRSGANTFQWDGQRLVLNDGTGGIKIGNNVGAGAHINASILMGTSAGQSSSNGASNIFLGDYSFAFGKGEQNVGIGYKSMELDTGSYNAAVGGLSGSWAQGFANSYLGAYGGYLATGDSSIYVGYKSGAAYNVQDTVYNAVTFYTTFNGIPAVALQGSSIDSLITNFSLKDSTYYPFQIVWLTQTPVISGDSSVSFTRTLTVNQNTLYILFTNRIVTTDPINFIILLNSKRINNSIVIGTNATADSSDQVVLGNGTTTTFKVGGSGGMNFATNVKYGNEQVIQWDSAKHKFLPGTGSSFDSSSLSDRINSKIDTSISHTFTLGTSDITQNDFYKQYLQLMGTPLNQYVYKSGVFLHIGLNYPNYKSVEYVLYRGDGGPDSIFIIYGGYIGPTITKKSVDLDGSFVFNGSNVNVYTLTVGDKFTFSFNGPSFYFHFYANNQGGMWKFNCGNDSVNVSTFSPTIVADTSIKLFTGSSDSDRIVTATFIGQDPDNPISSPRGWIKYDSTSNITVYPMSKIGVLNTSASTEILYKGSVTEFALSMSPYNSGLATSWIPYHGAAGSVRNVSAYLTSDQFNINPFSMGADTLSGLNNLTLHQIFTGYNTNDIEGLYPEFQFNLTHSFNTNGDQLTIGNKIEVLDTVQGTGYISMPIVQLNTLNKFNYGDTSLTCEIPDTLIDQYLNYYRNSGLFSSTENNYFMSFKTNFIDNAINKTPIGDRVFWERRPVGLGKLYTNISGYGTLGVFYPGKTYATSTSYVIGKVDTSGFTTSTPTSSVYSDSATFSGDGAVTSFTISVSPGWTPAKIFITPTTVDAAKATLYVSAITSTSFTVSVAGTTPPSGTNNVRFFYQLVK